MQVSTIDQIKIAYPDEWILLANPDMGDNSVAMPISKKLIQGIVLYHSKDKLEVAYKAKEVRQGYDCVTLFFTGETPKNRKFLL